MSERKVKRSHGSARRYSRHGAQVLTVEYQGDFASKFRHFSDSLGVPLTKLAYNRILFKCLGFHYVSDSRMGVSDSSRARPSSIGKYSRPAKS